MDIPVGKLKYQHFQLLSTLYKELEESKLAQFPSEIMECQHSDVRLDAFDVTRLLPELEIEPAGGFSSFLGLHISKIG
jgi:hypothetical protein